MSHRASLEASYTALLSKKQSEYKSNLTIKDWLKQVKTFFQASLTDKLRDYKGEFLATIKKCDENSSMEFFRNIQWADRSIHSGGSQKHNSSTFQKSKLTVLSMEPSFFLSGSFDQTRLSNSSFKKFLSIMTHEIKFGKGIIGKIIECFTKVFIRKYTQDSSKSQFSFFNLTFSGILKFKQPLSPSKKPLKSDADYKALLSIATNEIKEFRSLLSKLLEHQIDHSKNFSSIEWTSEINKMIFEAVNGLLFGWNDQFYRCIMSLVGLALSEKQSEFAVQTGIMKHWPTKEFQIHTTFRLNRESHAYLGAIDAMNMISQHFTPEDKFKSVHAIKTEVIKGVDNYWDEHDPKKSVSELVIQDDELLLLYTYLISRSNGGKLLCDLYFMEEFLDSDTLSYSENSFSFNLLNSAVSSILSLNKQKGLSFCG